MVFGIFVWYIIIDVVNRYWKFCVWNLGEVVNCGSFCFWVCIFQEEIKYVVKIVVYKVGVFIRSKDIVEYEGIVGGDEVNLEYSDIFDCIIIGNCSYFFCVSIVVINEGGIFKVSYICFIKVVGRLCQFGCYEEVLFQFNNIIVFEKLAYSWVYFFKLDICDFNVFIKVYIFDQFYGCESGIK